MRVGVSSKSMFLLQFKEPGFVHNNFASFIYSFDVTIWDKQEIEYRYIIELHRSKEGVYILELQSVERIIAV